MLTALERDYLMSLSVVFVEPEVLLVFATHLHAIYQQGHQLGHGLRLRHGDQDLGLFKQLDLKGHAASFLEDLTEIFVVGDPVSFNELILK